MLAPLNHVYVDEHDVAVVTPDYNDAKRTFNRYVREYPDAVVTWDTCEEYDQELGAFGIKRVMQVDPN